MGNREVLKRGDLQMTSAGTGIRHSEHTHGPVPVHFLQIWSTPATRGLSPQYFTRHFSDEEKKDRWAHVVAPVQPCPPHCPQCAAVPPLPPAGGVEPPLGALLVGGGVVPPVPESAALSLFLTNVSATEPYSFA